MEPEETTKQARAILGVPIGSIVLDVAVICAVVWWAGTTDQKLTSIDERLRSAETMQISPEVNRRVSQLETRVDTAERDRIELKQDISAQLERIENKLDRYMRGP